MVAREFQFRRNPPAATARLTNTVLNGRPRDYFVPSYRTSFSLKSVTSGNARYGTPLGCYRVDPSSFLLLNHGQEYSLEVQAETNTETLALFFQPGFLELASYERTQTGEGLLDEPHDDRQALPFGVCERLYPKKGDLARCLRQLYAGIQGCEVPPLWLEDRFYAIAGHLASLREETRREIDQVPGKRASTRKELYQRLHRARDYVESCFSEPLSVARIAGMAHLSPFHFQRTFKQVFKQTPLQYLQARRLAEARQLVETTDGAITRICKEVGFHSLGTFSSLFRRRFGCSPTQLRRRTRARQKSRIEESRA